MSTGNYSSNIIPTTIQPNGTNGNSIVNESFDFKNNPGLVFVLVACCLTGLWLYFITFYNSRLFAIIITKLLRRFYLKDGCLYIGSLSFSILSGKFMFRDVKYVTKDFSIQVVDGLAILKWWLVFKEPEADYYKEVLRDTKKLEIGKCRLNLQLNGLEFHLFNRSDLYNRIEEILKCERYGDARKSVQSLDVLNDATVNQTTDTEDTYNVWRDLFPVIRCGIRSGKLAIGNRLLENTFWIHFNTANATYSMPDAPCSLDHFTHYIHTQCSDIRMLLSKSPGYKGKTSDPPRWRNQDFTILHSGEAKITYYMDAAGLFPVEIDEEPESDPQWGIGIVFTKRAEINYGPWADLQRDALQKYFLPNDFQELPVTKPLEAEQRRLHTGLDVNIEFQEGASIEILFTRNEETVAIHIVCGDQNKGGEKPKPSVIHYHQPWMVNEYGYMTNIFVQLQEVEATTSLKFRKFLESDTIEVEINMAIPRMWNHFQHWTCELCFVKATMYFVWEHVDYMTDLINEWSVTTPPDIASFVPYEWEFNFYFRDFELILLVNQFNWVDCTNEDENSELALCGENLDINFVLPFTHYQPEKSEMKFFFRGETIMLRTFIPESNTIRRSVISLAKNSDRHMYPKASAKQQNTTEFDQPDSLDMYDEVDSGVSLEDQLSKGWRRRTSGSNVWIDVWSVPVIILNLFYKYYPMVSQDETTTRINEQCGIKNDAKEPLGLSPDQFTIELEAGPSAIRVLGYFWRQFFLGFKGNYFGLFQEMNEFNTNREIILSTTTSSFSNVNKEQSTSDVTKDMRHYRPLEVNLTIVLLDLQAELSMHTSTDVSSPQAYADRLTFEMHKTYQETRLQLIVSPVTVIVQDQLKKASDSSHLTRGFLTLTGLQFRGHAMFSDKDLPLGQDTIEYAWLVEVQLGHLKGKMTPSQLQMLTLWADTFLLHVTDEENDILNPDPVTKCHHMLHQEDCQQSKDGELCPEEESVKYKMVRFSLESLNFFLVEAECACNIQASPVRFASCNSKSDRINDGGSLFINEIFIRQFVQQLNMNYVETVKPSYAPSHSNNWVEVGVVGLGPITVDIQESSIDKTSCHQQIKFLTFHDRCTKRLWFIWNVEELRGKLAVDRCKRKICGCVGGCNFFGKNANGVRFFTNQNLDASSGAYNRYGSESLWGGGHSEMGSNVKEHLLRRSGYLSTSTSVVGSAGKLSANNIQQSRGTSFSSKIYGSGIDSVDQSGRSLSYIGQIRRDSSVRDTDSKLGFGRSRSIMDTDSMPMNEMNSAGSESTFYSCNSEQELEIKSRRSGKTASQTSLKSDGSTESYVSAVSSSGDLLEEDNAGDFVDAPMVDSIYLDPLVQPGLLSAYTSYMQPVKCINWRQSIPNGLKKKFSLLKNLKVIIPPGHRSSSPSLPNFNPSLQGKLPFSIQKTSVEDSNKKTNNSQFNEPESHVLNKSETSSNQHHNEDKKSAITMKFHQEVSLIVTPLLMDVTERFVTSLSPLSKSRHLCHLLDAIHSKCIEKSKQKFKEQTLFEIITYQSKEQVEKELSTKTHNEKLAIDILLPELKLLFFQISGERYTPSEQSSLSAKCGSEYSYDFDVRNSDSSLFAAVLTNLKLKAFLKNDDPAMFHCASRICQKLNDLNGPVITSDIIETLKKRSISDYTIFSGDLQSLKMQLLHLEGPSDKESKFTSIAREKTRIDFLVRKGGNLYGDNVSVVDSPKQDEFGEIIFEAGMNEITLSGSLRTELNSECFEEEKKEETMKASHTQEKINVTRENSVNNRKLSTSQQPNETVLNLEDPPQPSIDDQDENVFFEEIDEKDVIPLRMLKKKTPYEPLGSDSTISSAASSFAQKSTSTRKGYVALDIDPGEAGDVSDLDDDETPSSLFSGSDHTRGSRRSSTFNKESRNQESKKDLNATTKNPIIKKTATGGLNVAKVWINLAAPTHLQSYQSDTEQDVNLVMVLVPAASCWIPSTVECIKAFEMLATQRVHWNYTVLSALMGQGLPESGKLLKKIHISGAATQLSRFLQEEASSQLINALRRQTVGHRFQNLATSLENESGIPPKAVLEKGLYALARQWKTVIVGAEGVQNIFVSTNRRTKKPVVGRGNLPAKHLEYLSREHAESTPSVTVRDGNTNRAQDEVVDVLIEENDIPLKNFDTTHTEADVLLQSSDSVDSSDTDHEEPNNKRESLKRHQKKEQTLYDWMSKSPASSSAVQSPMREQSNKTHPTTAALEDDKPEDNVFNLDTDKQDVGMDQIYALRAKSPVVSVPTSGMQLAEATEVFVAILTSIGLKKVHYEADFLVENTFRSVASIEEFEVTLLTSTSSSEGEHKRDTPPVFVLNKLQILLNGTQKPSITTTPVHQENLATDVVFSVSVANIHQHVNFALVRLILQVIETLDVIKEEEKFAAKEKSEQKEKNGFDWKNMKSPLSSPGEALPKCWRNMYNVMNLYTTQPGFASLALPPNPSALQSPSSQKGVPDIIRAGKVLLSVTEQTFDPLTPPAASTSKEKPSHSESTTSKMNTATKERKQSVENASNVKKTLSVTGTVAIKKAQVTASISGLELCFEMRNLNGSLYRNKQTNNNVAVVDPFKKKEAPTNKLLISLHLDRLKINLIESVRALKDSHHHFLHEEQPDLRISRTLLTCKIYRSHGLHSNFDKHGVNERGHQHSLFSIGPIAVDIPQHPGALRSTVTRFSKRLQKHFIEFDDYRASRREVPVPLNTNIDVTSMKDSLASISSSASFRVTSNSILISAALLPSLRVEYKIEQINAWGNLSSKARFFCDLPYHVLSFNTKVHVVPLPPTTHIDLPRIKVEGHYLEIHQDSTTVNDYTTTAPTSNTRSHGYLSVSVNIGSLEQNLTTDLLNHIIFFQKGFVKEINEVVEVVDNTEQVPLLHRTRSANVEETKQQPQQVVPMIYSIKVALQGIQVTATTPSNTGIRLKTGELTMEITNQNPSSSVLNMPYNPVKVYGQAQVDINIALGFFNKNSYSSNENIYSVYANFDTSLGISNLLKEKQHTTSNMDKETILITLSKPQLFVMPSAVDKGVLVYLHYKNAYEYWMEQRAVLKTEFPAVAEHILNKLPQQANMDELSSYLILQVTVEGLGVCLPIKEVQPQERNTNNLSLNTQNNFADTEPGPALLVTAFEASVTCCSSGSFVSTGHFKKFCLRLADNFNHMENTWSLNDEDIMNTYIIPEGTYQLCSRTILPETPTEGAQKPGKWIMTLFWKMCGVDVHLDTNIGKRLSALIKALTTLTGESDVADISSVAEDFETLKEKTPDTHLDGAVAQDLIDGEGEKKATRKISLNLQNHWEEDSLEKQLLIQTTLVNELRRDGAHPEIIKREVKQLQEIENLLSKEFFKDVKKRFRRKTRRSTMDTSWRRRSFTRSSTHLQPGSNSANKLVRSKSQISHKRSISLIESTKSTADEIDGPFVESIDTEPLPPIIKPAIRKLNLEDYSEDLPPKAPTQVKFSDSTHDLRSENSDTNRSTAVPAAEALDFEFNMVIDIESGKCTLHSSSIENLETTPNKDTEKPRRTSDTTDMPPPQRNRMLRPMRSVGNILNTNNPPSTTEHTLLLIPGVKVRLYYLSKFTSETKNISTDLDNLSVTGSTTNRPLLSKSATLNASVQVESLSKETIVKPSLLDYLEKAFEPIMMKDVEDTNQSIDNESTVGTGSMLSSSGSSLYSFPVDVVVLIRVQPSDIRFSCFPISKVECLLRIPSLDFAITSTPPKQPSSGCPGLRKKPGRPRTSTSSSYQSNTSTETSEVKSGTSFTVCLAKFSFCIFHPYGKQYGSSADTRMGSAMFSDRRKDSRASRNQQMSGRKDSLSLNVEFIKFNLSRNTIKNLDDQKTSVQISAICDIGSAAFNYDMRRLNEILDVPKAWYKRSLMQRIFLGKEGALATQNTMNQSNKATPSEPSQPKPVVEPILPAAQETPKTNRGNRTPVMTHRRAVSSGTTFLSNLIASPFPAPKSANIARNDSMYLFDFIGSNSKDSKTNTTTMNDSSSSVSDPDVDEIDGPENVSTSPIAEWETRVIIAVNVSRVDVSTNMGNTMGQATWSTNDLRTNASVLINNIGLSSASIDLSVRQGALDAHGGVIGGYIEVYEIAVDGKFVENYGDTPFHYANIAMSKGEVRLDYMGSSIVMASLSSFSCKLEDHWLIPENLSEQNSGESARSGDTSFNSSVSTSTTKESGNAAELKSCEIYINCDTRWDDLQIIISRSTATDLAKMVVKLQDFLDQQHRSGIRALHTLSQSNTPGGGGGYYSSINMQKVPEENEMESENEPILKYQHWIELMNGLYGLQLNNLPARIPDRNVVLGGRLSLCGNFASLACFHGANFRTQNWGLFTVCEPSLQFTSETRVVEKSCQVMRAACVHDVTFKLGKSEKHTITERRKSTVNMYDFMATVRRVSRGRRNPPALGAPVQEWLNFVNTTSDDEIPMKASSSKKEEVSEKYSLTKGQGGSRKVSFAPKVRYENESEVILALPRLKVQLTTEHDQPMTSLISKRLIYNGKRVSKLNFPTAQGVHFVEMSFLSTFDDAIHVSMDVSLLFYLHDLILSYMKEQETSLGMSSNRLSSRSSLMEREAGNEPQATVTKTEQAIKKEEKYREFRVKIWRLEPRISLLSWAGKRMEPVSIDWVLEKLGFTHANMTIPKWVQRGALDPMDYTLAVVMEHLLVNMKVDQDDEE